MTTNQFPQADPSRPDRGRRRSLSIRFKIGAALLAVGVAAALILIFLLRGLALLFAALATWLVNDGLRTPLNANAHHSRAARRIEPPPPSIAP